MKKETGKEKKEDSPAYTCSDYRAEMILNSLQRRLATENLSESERRSVREEIKRLKAEMGMD